MGGSSKIAAQGNRKHTHMSNQCGMKKEEGWGRQAVANGNGTFVG